MAVLEFMWNCFLLLLFLGILKAALSLYWPSIGEWRYDDLHPSLRYHESCRAKQLLVNGVFFLAYPCVLCFRWYSANRGTMWTECTVERDEFERYVEYSREEEDLLRHGMIRGRMIIQKEIVLTGGSEHDDGSSYRKYDAVDECVVAVERDEPESDEQRYQSKCEPLNLSKDGDNGCDLIDEVPMQQCRQNTARMDSFHSSSEEQGDDDEISLISPTAREYGDSTAAPATGVK
ncbi:uncharacterized protein LOC118504651 [Anopheles stephensi]|uniref:uncharacterized protein LOC118504651 n=1 Tax=Anopheles stephensi TaxID=30069 RepID=UPI001658BC19|nr:uncharacterized protein LOC118504651 [Anopheles stephensi]XP_035895311.1 uncharacterized protein LOC118504651 [Anopheles stephensi]